MKVTVYDLWMENVSRSGFKSAVNGRVVWPAAAEPMAPERQWELMGWAQLPKGHRSGACGLSTYQPVIFKLSSPPHFSIQEPRQCANPWAPGSVKELWSSKAGQN